MGLKVREVRLPALGGGSLNYTEFDTIAALGLTTNSRGCAWQLYQEALSWPPRSADEQGEM